MIVGVLIRNEALKAVKRLAFWVTVLAYIGIFGLSQWAAYRSRQHAVGVPPLALPGAWDSQVASAAPVPAIFASILLLLLVCGEFEWRTARQNVIDGLSKEQWFAGKALLVPALVALFFGLQVVFGAGFALLGTDLHATPSLITGADLAQLGGAVLTCVGYASLALFVALAVRTPGSAVAMWLFYVAVLERLITGGLTLWSDKWKPIVQYFPVSVFGDLHSRAPYDAERARQLTEAALRFHRPPPEIWNATELTLVALAWIAALLVGAYFLFRRRDL